MVGDGVKDGFGANEQSVPNPTSFLNLVPMDFRDFRDSG